MRRKRIKAAKKEKLAKIKQIQSEIKKGEETGQKDDNRLQPSETGDIDASIKEGLKKVNKSLMKKDERFKNVIGKISKIKRKAENIKVKTEKEPKKKKKKFVTVKSK